MKNYLKKSTPSKGVIEQVLSLVKVPIIISLILTPFRFALELIGLQENVIFIVGLLWLTLGLSIYWGVKLIDFEHPYRILLLNLIFFSPISRIPVFILWWITKTWQLGTHYDIFDNWTQALVGQLVYGSLVQIIPGFILGSLTLLIMQKRKVVAE